MKKTILFVIYTIFILCSQAHAEIRPLPAEQAFKFSVETTQTDSILLNWQIAPGYYLYKERLKFTIKQPELAGLGKVRLPAGIEKKFPKLGSDEVYKNTLTIYLPILSSSREPISLLVNYQGCSDSGFCYPPITKLVQLQTMDGALKKIIAVTEYQIEKNKISRAPLSEQDQATSILENKNSLIALILFFGFGLLLAFTPCVLPMIPILSGIIVGHGQKLNTTKALSLSLVYVLGMAFTYAVAGVIVGLAGSRIQAAMQNPWVIGLFSLVFIGLALSLFGFYELKLPRFLQEPIGKINRKQHGGHYFSVALMGCLSTLIVSPCVTAPLVGVLAYIGNKGSPVFGGLALFMLGLGMGLPLLIIGTAFGKLLPKAGAWMNSVKTIFGVILLGVAIWMVSRIIPPQIILLLWASLMIISAIFMGALVKTPESNWGKLWKGIGIIMLTYGIIMIIGAAMGNSDPFRPLSSRTLILPQSQELNFKRVNNLADVKRELQLAKSQNKPVMLDFYADWCVACKEMEADVFADQEVINRLKNTVLLQADVTDNDDADRALENYFDVVAPPTIIFFNKSGEEDKSKRIVGKVSAGEFVAVVSGR